MRRQRQWSIRGLRPRARREVVRSSFVLLLLLLIVFAAAAGAAAEDPSPPRPLAGLPLTEALLELQERGLDIVFTSRLVAPGMTVIAEPAAAEPRRMLEEILLPHGLTIEEGAGGTLVVVAAAGRSTPGGIAGTVRSREVREPVAGATIRVVETGAEVVSAANGRFEVGGLAPGGYTLEVEARGFVARRVSAAVAVAGRSSELELELQPMPFVFDAIVVRPSRLSLFGEAPTAPLALSRGEIETVPHLAGDVFRALSLLPGVAANDVSARFHVHGGRRDEVQILLDGQELYDAFHLKDFDDALSIVAADGLSELNLTTGAFPANRGDRMGGVLDMTTAPAAGPLRTRLSLSVLNALASSAGSFDDGRGGWLAVARRGSLDLAGRIFDKEDPVFWDLFAKVEHRPAGRHLLRLDLLAAGDTFDFREVLGEELKSADTDYDDTYLWLTHEGVLGRHWVVDTSVSSSRIDRDRRGVEDEEEQNLEVTDLRGLDVLGLRQSWGRQAGPRRSFKWGLEARRYDASYDYFNQVESQFVVIAELTEPRAALVRFEDTFRGRHLAAWVSERFSPLSPLTVELGLRYDRHTLTDESLVSPRVSLAWRLGEAAVLRGAWGRFYQSQRPYELQIQDGETRFSAAERSTSWVLGYERHFGNGGSTPVRALRFEAYRRDVGDPRPRYESLFEPVNTFPEVEPDRVRIAPDYFRAEGLEVVLRGAAGPRFDWLADYALASAEDRIAGRQVRRPTDQPHALNLIVGWRLGRRWRVNAAWRLHTGWPTSPVSLTEGVDPEDPEADPEPVPVAGPLYGERLPTYHRMDLRASRERPLRSGRLLFFVDVQNLYDRENVAGFDLALEEGEGAGGETRLVIAAETWAGIFPSVGVTWEF